jgi:hypothetical protein
LAVNFRLIWDLTGLFRAHWGRTTKGDGMSKENKKRVRESHPVEYNRGYMDGLTSATPRQFPDDWERWTDDARAAWQYGWNDGAESQRTSNSANS